MPTTFKEWAENKNYDGLDALTKYYMRTAWDAALNALNERLDFWLRDQPFWDVRMWIKNDIATMLNEKREIETHKEKIKRTHYAKTAL